jgi:hypothetical protein
MGHDKKNKKKGGLGKSLFLLMGLAGAVVGVAWFLAPDMVRAQFASLTAMLGG